MDNLYFAISLCLLSCLLLSTAGLAQPFQPNVALFAVNWGEFAGDRIISPTGVELADNNPNPTLLYMQVLR